MQVGDVYDNAVDAFSKALLLDPNNGEILFMYPPFCLRFPQKYHTKRRIKKKQD